MSDKIKYPKPPDYRQDHNIIIPSIITIDKPYSGIVFDRRVVERIVELFKGIPPGSATRYGMVIDKTGKIIEQAKIFYVHKIELNEDDTIICHTNPLELWTKYVIDGNVPPLTIRFEVPNYQATEKKRITYIDRLSRFCLIVDNHE